MRYIKHPGTFLGPYKAYEEFKNGMREIDPKAGLAKNVASALDAAVAWGEVSKAIRNFGMYRPEEALSSMCRKVAQVVRYIGWKEIWH